MPLNQLARTDYPRTVDLDDPTTRASLAALKIKDPERGALLEAYAVAGQEHDAAFRGPKGPEWNARRTAAWHRWRDAGRAYLLHPRTIYDGP